MPIIPHIATSTRLWLVESQADQSRAASARWQIDSMAVGYGRRPARAMTSPGLADPGARCCACRNARHRLGAELAATPRHLRPQHRRRRPRDHDRDLSTSPRGRRRFYKEAERTSIRLPATEQLTRRRRVSRLRANRRDPFFIACRKSRYLQHPRAARVLPWRSAEEVTLAVVGDRAGGGSSSPSPASASRSNWVL